MPVNISRLICAGRFVGAMSVSETVLVAESDGTPLSVTRTASVKSVVGVVGSVELFATEIQPELSTAKIPAALPLRMVQVEVSFVFTSVIAIFPTRNP